MCGQHHAPAAVTPGKDPVPIVQEAELAPEPVWIGAENLAPPGFDPRTFQAVAGRYTDYAIPENGAGPVQIKGIKYLRFSLWVSLSWYLVCIVHGGSAERVASNFRVTEFYSSGA